MNTLLETIENLLETFIYIWCSPAYHCFYLSETKFMNKIEFNQNISRVILRKKKQSEKQSQVKMIQVPIQ